MTNNSMMNHTRHRQVELNNIQNQIGSQNRIQRLRDDPASAAHATRYQSYITRLERYSQNIEQGIDTYRVTEGHMRHAVDILQEVRALAVQGANGTYTREDTQHMARRVDELLGALVETANAKNGDGSTVFSGDRTRNLPFRVVEGNIPSYGGSLITSVEYTGSIGLKQAEISDGSYIPLNFPGNRVFWAENQAVYGAVDSSNYLATEDSTVALDGFEVPINAGDNIYSIMSKINRSDAGVRASLDPVTSALVLESTTPHQIWIQDKTGQVFTDLGILSKPTDPPPHNTNPDAQVFGGSLFDAVIRLRDELFAGDAIDIGGAAIAGLDGAMNNLLSEVGSLGAKTERLDFSLVRIEKEIPDMYETLSKEVDIDMTEAITRLKTIETTHQAALAALARIVPRTLLDFLR